MNSSWNSVWIGGIVAVALSPCAMGAAGVEAKGKAESTATTSSTLWSTSSVLELYKLSGWRIVEVRRIWSNEGWPKGDPRSRHNAFTDLARFKGRWYCVFRVGENHGIPGPLGGLRVIRSEDGKHWSSVFFYHPPEDSIDARDSKLLVTDDGKIVLCGYESYRLEPARTNHRQIGVCRSMTWVSSDGEHWEGPNTCEETENTWVWGSAWHKGVGYGVAYAGKNGNSGALYRTVDGKTWQLVAKDIFPLDAQGRHTGNEATLLFDSRDNAWMYVRDVAPVAGKLHNVGFATPPYTHWDWSRGTSVNLGGPKMIRLSDGRVLAAGRIWGRQGGPGYGDSRTSLFELDPRDGQFYKILNLPSQGDNAYPGLVEKDGELWISYYSTHEDPNPEHRRAHLRRACIYLARVTIGGPRWAYMDKYDLSPVQPERNEAAKPGQVLPPKFPVNQAKEIFHVDISRFANRALADEVADDGGGGWTDQGPACDMRNLPTGRREFGGVPFDVASGKSVVVLRSSCRKPGNLPEKVTIPVGRKADALYFLHSAAFFEANWFKYVLHYADGKDVTITMDSRNFTDWICTPIARFPREKGTFTTVVQTVPNQIFGHGSVYRTEWIAPPGRRNVVLTSIEFAHDGRCVPLLLAITGVTKK